MARDLALYMVDGGTKHFRFPFAVIHVFNVFKLTSVLEGELKSSAVNSVEPRQ